MIINKKSENTNLFEIEFTPKGTNETVLLHVYAKNRLEASNCLILNQMYGKQHSVRICNVNLMK